MPYDIEDQTRTAMIALLNARLADTLDLKLAVKQAHWTVRGPSFVALHELFDAIAARLEDHADTMAERVMALGGQAVGTSQAIAATTRLDAYPTDLRAQDGHIAALSARMSGLAASLRAAIDDAAEAGDQDTADLFTSASRDLDKDLWFVEAHRPHKTPT